MSNILDVDFEPHPEYPNDPNWTLVKCGATYFEHFNSEGHTALERSWGHGDITLSCMCEGSRTIPMKFLHCEPGHCSECAHWVRISRPECKPTPKPANPKAVRKRKAAKPRKRAARKRVTDLAEGE